MRHRIDRHLTPAEGLDSRETLFTSPPIESLEMLKELGEIARNSLEPEVSVEVPIADENRGVSAKDSDAENFDASSPTPGSTPAQTPAAARAEARQSQSVSDARLIEALLEYHRARRPALGARTSPKPSSVEEPSFEAGNVPNDRPPTDSSGFVSIEIPIVKHYVPKSASHSGRTSNPTQTILKTKPRS